MSTRIQPRTRTREGLTMKFSSSRCRRAQQEAALAFMRDLPSHGGARHALGVPEMEARKVLRPLADTKRVLVLSLDLNVSRPGPAVKFLLIEGGR